jgi:Nucleotide-diphospho-sugar transferase
MNIGMYAAKANNATIEYFPHCLDVAITYQIHDQQLMQELQLVSSRQQSGSEVAPRLPKVTFHNHVDFEFMDSHEIAASEWPRLTLETISVHPLS